MKRLTIVLLLCAVLSFLCACLTEEEKQEILADISSQTAASAKAKQTSSVSSSSGGSVDSSASGSTQVDNKPPKPKDGVTIHISEKDLKKASSIIASWSSAIESDAVIGRSKTDELLNEPYSSRDDLELSVPDYWQSSHVATSNPDKYPWEIPENVPKDSFELETPEFSDFGEGDTGANGSSISLPSEFPSGVKDYNFNPPEMPNKDKISAVEFPDDLKFDSNFNSSKSVK